ncbi:MAG: thiamine pyrophosphate-dependent dehydrogenase E1 component subunit alpha [Thermaerobacter sp.]|nr:thiamine pyrophosphate-dependent dehydrogenase E1 component subunit alpha [Thermaerobacter sp.]
MKLIRSFEDAVAELFAAGRIPGFVHLYAGEEAIGVGIMAHLGDDDYITSTHRGHGHCIAKGVSVREMMAELFGKATGSNKGKGGSMHIADVGKGMLGANGIVGGGGPLAVGAGLTLKTLGKKGVTVCFFGDGAAEQGTMHEAMNLASIWKLPVVFVCENNLFAESTPWTYHASVKNIADRAAAYDMPGVVVPAHDVFAVYEVANEAVQRARRGEGPSLIEARGFRFYGHFQGDPLTYRTPEDEARWRAHDPLTLFRARVLDQEFLAEDALDEVDRQVATMIAEATNFAESSAYPADAALLEDVYVSYP